GRERDVLRHLEVRGLQPEDVDPLAGRAGPGPDVDQGRSFAGGPLLRLGGRSLSHAFSTLRSSKLLGNAPRCGALESFASAPVRLLSEMRGRGYARTNVVRPGSGPVPGGGKRRHPR